jgi:hypothetical protein
MGAEFIEFHAWLDEQAQPGTSSLDCSLPEKMRGFRSRWPAA